MTGTGGWAYFSATRYMLGIRPQFDYLLVDPCIPADWKSFTMDREWRGAVYHITVLNPDGVMKGVHKIQLNGTYVNRIDAQDEGSENDIVIIMGNKEARS
jgi:N,N'-diacetylchitobiose phosphorylase